MKPLFAALTIAALSVPFAAAHAGGSTSYDFCGGTYNNWTGFAFCASVQVSVSALSSGYQVQMTVTNESGHNGSYSGTLFAEMGLDNVPGSLAVPTNLVITQGTNTICTNATDALQGSAKCYNVQTDQAAASGEKLDFLLQTSNGVNLSLASACSGSNNYLYTGGISMNGSPCAPKPVTLTFDVTEDWNPATTGNVYIKGQGALGSTECETDRNSPTGKVPVCTPTTVPEPSTIVLVASGLMGLGVPTYRRRRRRS